MCDAYNDPVFSFAGLACALGQCKLCGPRLAFTTHACPCEVLESKQVSIKLIDTSGSQGNANRSRNHFETFIKTRKAFVDDFVTKMEKMARHFYLARHARRALRYMGHDFLQQAHTDEKHGARLLSRPRKPVASVSSSSSSSSSSSESLSSPSSFSPSPSLAVSQRQSSRHGRFNGALFLQMVLLVLIQCDFSEKYRHTTNYALTGQAFKSTEVATHARTTHAHTHTHTRWKIIVKSQLYLCRYILRVFLGGIISIKK